MNAGSLAASFLVVVCCVAGCAHGQCSAVNLIKSVSQANLQMSQLQLQIGSFYTMTNFPNMCPASLVRPIQNFWSEFGNRTLAIQRDLVGVTGCIQCNGQPQAKCDKNVFNSIDAVGTAIDGMILSISAQINGRCSSVIADGITNAGTQLAQAISLAATMAHCI